MLCELSKVLERIVHSQLSIHLDRFRLRDPRQAGFTRHHSTQTALLRVLDDVRQAIDNYKITILLLFDFSKAFDVIPHDEFIAKFRRLQLSDTAMNWFFRYLADRIQAVVDDGGRISEWLRVATGVPQGSILGPLLFTIYISDLPAVLNKLKYMCYADDIQAYIHVARDDLLQGIHLAQADGQAIADWALANGIPLNLIKTKAMILGSDKYLRTIDLDNIPKIIINGVPINYTTSAKNLGATITSTLNWQDHVCLVTRRAYGALASLVFISTRSLSTLRKTWCNSLCSLT